MVNVVKNYGIWLSMSIIEGYKNFFSIFNVWANFIKKQNYDKVTASYFWYWLNYGSLPFSRNWDYINSK